MKKGMKNIAVKIFVMAFVLLIGNDVRALTFEEFFIALERSVNETINLSDTALLTFEHTLDHVGGNKTLIGRRNDFVILDGGDVGKFYITNRIIQLYDNFEFRVFGDGVFEAYNGSIINFTSATFKFTDNELASSVISANKNMRMDPVNITFTSSTVIFENNASINNGVALNICYDSNVNFIASTVNFINNNIVNRTTRDGGAIFANEGANINFTDSIVHFTSNSSLRDAGAIYANNGSNINFTDSIVHFTSNIVAVQNKGSAIYADNNSKILFANTKVSFIANANAPALYAANGSEINISGDSDIEFIENRSGDILLENDSGIIFLPESGKSIRFKGKITSQGNGNIIRKTGGGEVIFNKATPISLPDVDFLIEAGTARFDIAISTFKQLNISQGATLGISIDFLALAGGGGISAFFIDSIIIADGVSLSVQALNEGTVEATSVPFVYVSNQYSGSFANIVGGDNYFFSWEDYGNYAKVGFLRFEDVAGGGGSGGEDSGGNGSGEDGNGGSGSNGDGSGNGDSSDVGGDAWRSPFNNPAQVFIANTIKQAAISDNSAIYSNVKEKAWILPQASGGTLGDDDGDFNNSASGAKGGFTLVEGEDFSAGAFAGFASRSYKQDSNKATASDVDFGAYVGLGLGGNASLAGFVGYGLQSLKAESGGSHSDFDVTVVKFGAKAEYAAGLISPFFGLEGAVVSIGDDIDLGGAKLEATSYTRLSSQLGAKIGKQVGKLSWYGKAYIDLLLAGNKPEYTVKPDAEDEKSITVEWTAESMATFGLGGGARLPVSGVVDIFAAVDVKINPDFFGYQSNIGASFKF